MMWDRCMWRLIERYLTNSMQMPLAIMLMHMKIEFFAMQPAGQPGTKLNRQRLRGQLP